MKIRNGFVSNSSSSSFIVLLPRNFDTNLFVDNMTDEEISKYDGEYANSSRHNHSTKLDRTKLKQLISGIVLQGGNYNDDDGFYLMTSIFKPFIIFSVDSGPDEGRINIVSEKERENMKKLMENEIRYDKLKKLKKDEI